MYAIKTIDLNQLPVEIKSVVPKSHNFIYINKKIVLSAPNVKLIKNGLEDKQIELDYNYLFRINKPSGLTGFKFYEIKH